MFNELRLVGVKVMGGNRRLSGEIKEFLIDDLGFTVDWTVDVHYVVRDMTTGMIVYDADKTLTKNTAKFANAFAALN